MQETHWSTPSPPWCLAEGIVDVWRADLAIGGERERKLLSGVELERVARFAHPDHGRRWARARGILRALLGRYLDADPTALRFAEGPHGKPALAEPSGGIEFNLSHSEDVALYAFSRGQSVGVDVEVARRPVDVVAIAARMLGAEQARRLRALDGEEREQAFLRAWTRHEAALKCRGTGIGAAAAGVAPEEGLWLADLGVGPGAAAALAVDGPPCEVRCWSWDG